MLGDQRILDVLHADVAALAGLPDTALLTPVPSCPGWRVADLVTHLGRVHHRAIRLLQGIEFVPLDEWEPTPEGPGAVGWARAVGAELAAAAALVDPDTPTDTWLGPRPARFWLRRMMQETSVHRWDAQHATGTPEPIAADVGADGVDELLSVFCPRHPASRWAAVTAPGEGSIHLHATDTQGEWWLRFSPGGLDVTAAPQGPPRDPGSDVVVRGGGGALDLLVWNRRPVTPEVSGDQALLDRFLAAAQF